MQASRHTRVALWTINLALLIAIYCEKPLSAQTIQVNKDNKTIAITATDSAEAEADTADISIGFTAFGTDQTQTYADASKTSNKIIDALLAAGIKRTQIHSDQQRLNMIESSDKRYQQGLRFTFTQSWKVTAKAADAADVLHLAISAGANDSGAIDWRIADDNALEADAAAKALAHAKQIGERMASGLHTSLGPLVYASNQAAEGKEFDRRDKFAALAAPTKIAKPLAIIPDKVTRSATVYAVFSIQ